MEVLFTFLAQRYERKNVIITSNLVLPDRFFDRQSRALELRNESLENVPHSADAKIARGKPERFRLRPWS